MRSEMIVKKLATLLISIAITGCGGNSNDEEQVAGSGFYVEVTVVQSNTPTLFARGGSVINLTMVSGQRLVVSSNSPLHLWLGDACFDEVAGDTKSISGTLKTNGNRTVYLTAFPPDNGPSDDPLFKADAMRLVQIVVDLKAKDITGVSPAPKSDVSTPENCY